MLRLGRLQQTVSIVDAQGRPTPYFQRFYNDTVQAIEEAVGANAQTLLGLQQTLMALQASQETAQAAQQAANNAQITADAGGGARSGSDYQVANTDPTPITITSVPLLSVSAGNLTIEGTGPQQSEATVVTDVTSGSYDVIETVAAVDTVVFSGTFVIYPTEPVFGVPQAPTVSHTSAASVASFVSARASTGTVDYRVDISTSLPVTGLAFYMYVRRA
jgi:hypothetical protein